MAAKVAKAKAKGKAAAAPPLAEAPLPADPPQMAQSVDDAYLKKVLKAKETVCNKFANITSAEPLTSAQAFPGTTKPNKPRSPCILGLARKLANVRECGYAGGRILKFVYGVCFLNSVPTPFDKPDLLGCPSAEITLIGRGGMSGGKIGPRSVWAVPHPPRAAPIYIRIRKLRPVWTHMLPMGAASKLGQHRQHWPLPDFATTDFNPTSFVSLGLVVFGLREGPSLPSAQLRCPKS